MLSFKISFSSCSTSIFFKELVYKRYISSNCKHVRRKRTSLKLIPNQEHNARFDSDWYAFPRPSAHPHPYQDMLCNSICLKKTTSSTIPYSHHVFMCVRRIWRCISGSPLMCKHIYYATLSLMYVFTSTSLPYALQTWHFLNEHDTPTTFWF